MEPRSGAQISCKAFIQTLEILFILMMGTGILTLVVPSGTYEMVVQDGRSVIDPDSFKYVEKPDYPIWRWFLAPLEVLAGPDSTILITIIVFLILVGIAFAVLDESGILKAEGYLK